MKRVNLTPEQAKGLAAMGRTVTCQIPVGKTYHTFRYGDFTTDDPQKLADHLGMQVRLGKKVYLPTAKK